MSEDVLFYKGKDVRGLSKEELIEALKISQQMYESQRQNIQQEREMMRLFRKFK